MEGAPHDPVQGTFLLNCKALVQSFVRSVVSEYLSSGTVST
jgi:hypothetical protein